MIRRVGLLVALLLLLAAGFWWWHQQSGAPEPTLVAPEVVPSTTTAPSVTLTPTPQPPKLAPKPTTKKPPVPTSSTGTPTPPKVELHKELIPKNIEIIRCYYASEVAPPGTTFGFDINGTGFTTEFHKMISVESGHANVKIKNLALITANQIHGEIEVGAAAKTGFVYPRVLIKGLPVFSAPDPFAVVRKGEVLTIFFTNMEEDGRGGLFRVITHLDEKLVETFRVVPSTAGILITDMRPQLPYLMQGHMKIQPGVPPGEHGLTILIQNKEVFRRMGMIRIVRPTVGQMGFIQNLVAEDRYRRPGDRVQLYVQGTGLSINDLPRLHAEVEEFNMGKGSFTYISPLQLRLSFDSPAQTPIGLYSVKVMGESGTALLHKKHIFQMVPANWVAGVQVSPPLRAGSRSQIKVLGRDFSESFASSFRITVDEPGLTLGPLTRLNDQTLIADISAATNVAPGDYWLHLSAQGTKITPPFGSIIKVENP